MSEIALGFVLLLAGVVVFIGGLFLYAWLRRNRRPPRPTQPYREWRE